jgi:thymidylate synthase
MMAQVLDYEPGDFVHTLGDVHIYSNHREQVATQLARQPHALPTMQLNPDVRSLWDFRYEDFELRDYRCHPAIRAPIAI